MPHDQKSDYLVYKQFHDDRYSTAIRRGNNWQRMAFSSCLLTAFAIGGMIYFGRLPKSSIQFLGIDKQGRVTYVGESKDVDLSDQVWGVAKRNAFETFVTDWRTVTTDPKLRAHYWDGYADWVMKGSKADFDLWKWFNAHNPTYRSADGETVTIRVTGGGPVTDNTYQLLWDETTYKSGKETVQSWNARFTYKVGGAQVKPKAGSYNGLGILITEINGPDEVGDPKEVTQQ